MKEKTRESSPSPVGGEIHGVHCTKSLGKNSAWSSWNLATRMLLSGYEEKRPRGPERGE